MSSNVSKVIELSSSKEYDAFKKKYQRAIIFYGADWCAACTQISPLYTRIAKRYHKYIAMAHADIGTCNLDFSRVPIFVSLHKGKEIDSMEGADAEGLKQLVKGALQYKSKSRRTQVKDAEARIVGDKQYDISNEIKLK